jgi:hypothetical protein
VEVAQRRCAGSRTGVAWGLACWRATRVLLTSGPEQAQKNPAGRVPCGAQITSGLT